MFHITDESGLQKCKFTSVMTVVSNMSNENNARLLTTLIVKQMHKKLQITFEALAE